MRRGSDRSTTESAHAGPAGALLGESLGAGAAGARVAGGGLAGNGAVAADAVAQDHLCPPLLSPDSLQAHGRALRDTGVTACPLASVDACPTALLVGGAIAPSSRPRLIPALADVAAAPPPPATSPAAAVPPYSRSRSAGR